jgi:hypothetical protein
VGNSPKMYPNPFLSKYNFHYGKSWPIICAINNVIKHCQNTAKQAKICPIWSPCYQVTDITYVQHPYDVVIALLISQQSFKSFPLKLIFLQNKNFLIF